MSNQGDIRKKTVFQTDENGIYVGRSFADPDPKNPGNWLIPAGCVEAEPPFIPRGKKAEWAGYKWKILDT